MSFINGEYPDDGKLTLHHLKSPYSRPFHISNQLGQGNNKGFHASFCLIEGFIFRFSFLAIMPRSFEQLFNHPYLRNVNGCLVFVIVTGMMKGRLNGLEFCQDPDQLFTTVGTAVSRHSIEQELQFVVVSLHSVDFSDPGLPFFGLSDLHCNRFRTRLKRNETGLQTIFYEKVNNRQAGMGKGHSASM